MLIWHSGLAIIAVLTWVFNVDNSVINVICLCSSLTFLLTGALNHISEYGFLLFPRCMYLFLVDAMVDSNMVMVLCAEWFCPHFVFCSLRLLFNVLFKRQRSVLFSCLVP